VSVIIANRADLFNGGSNYELFFDAGADSSTARIQTGLNGAENSAIIVEAIASRPVARAWGFYEETAIFHCSHIRNAVPSYSRERRTLGSG